MYSCADVSSVHQQKSIKTSVWAQISTAGCHTSDSSSGAHALVNKYSQLPLCRAREKGQSAHSTHTVRGRDNYYCSDENNASTLSSRSSLVSQSRLTVEMKMSLTVSEMSKMIILRLISNASCVSTAQFLDS